ncbi:long-chain-fatty-acid--CoA ligase [Nocardioides sp. YIM 152315]|uniref:long-chain-fatty-acid--CoA ligase n=1 Tax=Nocardioides sp. YIM 152315 TaxID=3031760 RepID=UPI0023DA6B60|nr:long-chain-fatty-acid--CoA ligase [Nocardioides sp. YIM 152315]MDF1602225.1 long-chain-fatty-acid--CoA ligase [Nocardioides sp. YIM 152315]
MNESESSGLLLSTMQDIPITVRRIFDHGRDVHASSKIVTYRNGAREEVTFGDLAKDADGLATALADLGVTAGDRVATLMWNQPEHLAVYFAATCSGAVVHPLNPRLTREQLIEIMRLAQDRVLFVDDSMLDLVAGIRAEVPTLKAIISIGGSGSSDYLEYEALRKTEGVVPRPDIDERAAAVLCFTSGTTGSPKGVAYSHRSLFLHTQAISTTNVYGIGQPDSILLSVPIYHTNGASMPIAGWMAGARLVMPERNLQPLPMGEMIEREGVTLAVGVVTLWNDLLERWRTGLADLSSLRLVVSGGTASPRALLQEFRDKGVPVIQGWGMTESLGICTMGHPPAGVEESVIYDYLATGGRIVGGVRVRVRDVDTGVLQPHDGESVGELEVEGPWITGGYVGRTEGDGLRDGWFRTGDIGTVTPDGYVRITDRLKDVIKSGGEWISSLDLEDAIRSHPAVRDVCVIGVPDERWQERPLAVVVGDVRVDDLVSWLKARVARWWIPERWVVVDELPRTSVGKIDKRQVRRTYDDDSYALAPTAQN